MDILGFLCAQPKEKKSVQGEGLLSTDMKVKLFQIPSGLGRIVPIITVLLTRVFFLICFTYIKSLTVSSAIF